MSFSIRNSVARITVTNAVQGVRTYDLRDGERLNVGREASNEIIIQDNRASRVHACFFTRGSKCFVSDLFSRNGTTVNGEPLVGDLELHNKDVINVGFSVITIEIGPVVTQPIEGDVTATGGFTNTKIASAIFRASEEFTSPQLASIKTLVAATSGQILLTGSGWLAVAWPGSSLNQMALEAAVASVDIFIQLKSEIDSLGILIFTMSALLEDSPQGWKIDLLGDPKKTCEELNESQKTFPFAVMAEQSIIKRLPKDWISEELATFRIKNDFQPRTFYKIISDPKGAIL